MSAFKAYDIRGIYPDAIDESLARAVGYHFAKLLGQGPIVIGRDIRPSSVSLSESLADGIQIDAGGANCDVDVRGIAQLFGHSAGQRNRLGSRQIHFPVASNKLLSHPDDSHRGLFQIGTSRQV